MTLHLQPADSLVFLQLPPGGAKRIPQCDICVRMGRVLAVRMPDDDLLAPNRGQHYEYLRRQMYGAVDGRRPGGTSEDDLR
jgi:hypothetical protein